VTATTKPFQNCDFQSQKRNRRLIPEASKSPLELLEGCGHCATIWGGGHDGCGLVGQNPGIELFKLVKAIAPATPRTGDSEVSLLAALDAPFGPL
jgi:hypothetical protein